MFAGVEGLTTLALEDKEIGEVKLSDTTKELGIFDNDILTCKGDTPLDDMAEVGV